MTPLSATWLLYVTGGADEPPEELLDTGFICPEYRSHSFAYPMDYGELREFPTIEGWYAYVQSLRIYPKQVAIPYVDAFDEALRALFMSYLFPEFCKLGEMKALAVLEGTLKEAYRHKMCERVVKPKAPATTTTTEHKPQCVSLDECLEWAVLNDNLDSRFVDKTIGRRRPEALNVIRDKQAHGRLDEMFPWGGLFEVIKETIEYAFRSWNTYDIHQLREYTIAMRMGAGASEEELGYNPWG